MKKVNFLGCIHYLGENYYIPEEKCGKWVWFFNGRGLASKICEDAIEKKSLIRQSILMKKQELHVFMLIVIIRKHIKELLHISWRKTSFVKQKMDVITIFPLKWTHKPKSENMQMTFIRR